MRFFRDWKVVYKISLTLGIILILSLIILLFTLRQINHSSSLQSAEETSKLNALLFSQEINYTFNPPKRKLDQLLRSVMSLRESNSINREQFNQMLIEYIEENPNLLDVYMTWEPNAFDGQDAKYANTEGYDQTGRLVSLYLRKNDQIVREPILDYEDPNASWYQDPKKLKKTILSDPYLYPIDGCSICSG